jgi:chemotaxis protein histidine kinase CheA/CheY-like chemotaxis protein
LDHLVEVDTKLSDAVTYLERTTRALSADTRSLRAALVGVEAELREARLIPLEWGFARLDSALGELKRVCHRSAELVVQGGEIKIDKSLVDQLLEPLLHLLRNAMAHGIEDPEVRLARGKTPQGHIAITATMEMDFLTILFEDDGGGIDQNAVRQTLESQGKVRPEDILTEEKLLSAVFEPGFSTRSSTDVLSGRGVGLDIVKRSVTRLGGELHLESKMGQGTRFQFSLPVSGTITQGLLFKLGGQVYAVPATHVIQVLPVGHNLLSGYARSSSESAEVPVLSGTRLPVLKLHAILGAELPPGRQAAAMHIRFGGRNFLLTCDKVIGPRTIVIRPTGPLIGLVPIYAGVTVSGAGKAQLVLDLGALSAYLDRPKLPTLTPRRGQPRLLIVDYSRLGREASARLLATAGYQTVTAEDGYEAWDLLNERRFDAVITGLEMPRLDGFQLISRIRREPTLSGLPVLVLSYRTSQANRERCMAAGADVFLPKSRQRKSLADAVLACLASRGQSTTT